MNIFSLNLMLMLLWVVLTADFSAVNLFIGFVLGWFVLWVIKPLYGNTGYFMKQNDLFYIFTMFLIQLIFSSFRVAWDVLTPSGHSKPGIVALPLDVTTETQILLLSSFISLTPGTLSVDLSKDRKTLYVHTMFMDDVEDFKKTIKKGIERRIIRLLSRTG